MSTEEKYFEAAERASQLILEKEIEKARNAPKLQSVGACYNCLESLEEGLLFCDTDCRDDYEKRKRYGKA